MRKKPKNPPIKFTLEPRLDGEIIEDWIKREANRISENRAENIAMREKILATKEEICQAGLDYAQTLNQESALQKQMRIEIKKFKDECDAKVKAFKRETVAPARKKHADLKRKHKTLLAKYNTLYKRCFNAVKTKVFQNMKSICGVKHTWADPKVKRSIQSGDINQKHERRAHQWKEETEEKIDGR